MSCVEKRAEIVERSVVRINVEIIGDVVAVVAQWRRIKRQQPNGRDAKLVEIIELLNQAAKIADAVTIAVMKGFDVQLVDDRVFVPKRIGHWFSCAPRHGINLCRTKRAAQSSVNFARKIDVLQGLAQKKSELSPGYPLTLVICDAMHCHWPPRFIQVSVKRKVRSNALPSLPVPFSRARPVTTIIFGPKALTFSFSFFADL